MERSAEARRCRCGGKIARDNKGKLCAACLRSSRDRLAAAPVVPAEFWQHPTMRAALAEWHMGQVIRAYRKHPWHGQALKQATVAAWMHLDQTQLSRIENGPALTDLHRLMQWAHVLGIPTDLLWFKVPRRTAPTTGTALAPRATSSDFTASAAADAGEEAVSPLNRRNLIKSGIAVTVAAGLDGDASEHLGKAAAEPSRYLDQEVVGAFVRQLDAAMHADGQAGSTRPLPAVLDVLRAVHQSARDVRPAVRRELMSVGARGAEFAGWLYRDARNLTAASYWHDRATEWAQEACDFPMQGYVLLKRAQMAYDERDAVRVFTLAEAARRGPWQLPARVRAEVAQIEARGMAMLGEPISEVERTLDASYQWLDRAVVDESPLGGHYSMTTLTLQTASCYIEAGQPRRAADLYEHAFREHNLSHRDQGYFLARRSVALALAGAPDEAAAVGLDAANIAAATDSQRTIHHLRRTVRRLEPWATRPAPRALAEVVRQSASPSPSG